MTTRLITRWCDVPTISRVWAIGARGKLTSGSAAEAHAWMNKQLGPT